MGAFFGLCVWLVPFALFVSLTAGEYVLPSTAEISNGGMNGMGGGERRRRTGMAKALVEGVKEWFAGTAEVVGWRPVERRSRFD